MTSIRTDSSAPVAARVAGAPSPPAVAADFTLIDAEMALRHERKALEMLDAHVQNASGIERAAVLQRLRALGEVEQELALIVLTHLDERQGISDESLSLRVELLNQPGQEDGLVNALCRLAAFRKDDLVAVSALFERAGDIILERVELPERALIQYQAAFRADKRNRSATRKAAKIYASQGRDEHAKLLLDVEHEQLVLIAATDDDRHDLANQYLRVAEGLFLHPKLHAAAKDACEHALSLVAGHAPSLALKKELESFADHWRDHVRRLRDAAIEVRDKREAARRYLAIAEIYATHLPNDAEIPKNVEKALLLAPGYRPALKFLESRAREDGKLDAFITELKRQAGGVRAVDVAVEMWLFVAMLEAERGTDRTEVIAAYERVRKADPRNLAAIHALTELHLEGSNYAEAAGVMEAFLRETSDVEAKRRTLRQLVRLYEVELSDKDKACARLEQLRALDPDDEATLVQLRDMYEAAGQTLKVADVIEAQLRARPDIQDVRLFERLFAIYRTELATHDRALNVGRRQFLLAPTDTLQTELEALARSLLRMPEWADTLVEAAQRQPAAAGRKLRLRAAEIHAEQGDNKRARGLLESMLDVDGNDAEVLGALDRLLSKDASPAEVVQVLERRLAVVTDVVERAKLLHTLGEAYIAANRLEDARRVLQQAHGLAPANAQVAHKLEDVLFKLEAYEPLVVLLQTMRQQQEPSSLAFAELTLKWARVLDDKLRKGADAVPLLLELVDSGTLAPETLSPAVEMLLRLLVRGTSAVAIAETLQPLFARQGAWRKHVEMLQVRIAGESDVARRQTLLISKAHVLENELKSPREAFDAWAEIVVADATNDEHLTELLRTAELANAHAALADVLLRAADTLPPESAGKQALLTRRATLLQGVLGDELSAITAHKAVLHTTPGHLASLDGLIELYEKRDDRADLRDALEQRVAASSETDAPRFALRLGVLLSEKLDDKTAAKPWLERAAAFEGLANDDKLRALRALREVYLHVVAHGSEAEHDAARAALPRLLKDLGGLLSGKERSATRAEQGEAHLQLKEWRDATAAFEAALANDAEQHVAINGLRRIVDAADVPVPERSAVCRSLLSRYDAAQNHAGRAHVLGVMLSLERNPSTRRALVGQLVSTYVDELEMADEALDILLAHLAEDPEDEPARKSTEQLAQASARTEELKACYASLRISPHADIARLYAERLADICIERGDLAGGIEALAFVAELEPHREDPWLLMLRLYERQNDHAGMARAMEEATRRARADERPARLVELAEFCFDVLDEPIRGLTHLRDAHRARPQDPRILMQLEARLRLMQGDAQELAAVMLARSQLETAPAVRAQLLLEAAELFLRVDRPTDAVLALTQSLRLERDGHATARTTDLLLRLAASEGEPAAAALQAIIEHHRAQKAWQPLVDSLEIAAQKTDPGTARAAIYDEITDLHEKMLRVMQLAFIGACRALREEVTSARVARVVALAETTANWSDALEVLEDAAQSQPLEAALPLLAQAVALAERIKDEPAQSRLLEATIARDPSNADALAALEALHRRSADETGLVAILARRAERSSDPVVKRAALLELGGLLVATDPVRAERAFCDVLEFEPNDPEALRALEDIYERNGNSAALVDVLATRLAAEPLVERRVGLRVRRALTLLKRRGDPAAARDELAIAVGEAPHVVDVRQALVVLLDHARARGTPPVADVALLLEQTLRAQNDLAALPPVMDARLSVTTDRSQRTTLLQEMALVQERIGQDALAFSTMCRALTDSPENAPVRADAERLAALTDNFEALSLVYEDIVDEVTDATVRVQLHKRMAEIAESASGDTRAARDGIAAAVSAGADDVDTLLELVRLTRTGGDARQLAEALQQLGRSAEKDARFDVAKQTYAELGDVAESIGDFDVAVHAAERLYSLDESDAGSKATVERMLNRAERYTDLRAFLQKLVAETDERAAKAQVLARLAYLDIEQLRDFAGALEALQQLERTAPDADAIVPLGTRLLLNISPDNSAAAKAWRGDIAKILEPRLAAQQAHGELVPVLRLRLEVETDRAERSRLYTKIIDIEERVLNRPEQAMVTLARALGEDPADSALRQRAELLSVKLFDLESLLGVYEDILDGLAIGDPLRVLYAVRAGELFEGGVGQPVRAAEFYEQGYQAAVTQRASESERLQILERMERLARVVGDPQQLALGLKRKADVLSTSDPAKARQALLEAATLESMGLSDHAAAMATLKRVLSANPQDVQALRALGEAAERAGRFPDVAESLERELAVIGNADPARSMEARFKLGVVLDLHLGLADDALVQFQAILQDSPNHKQTRQYLESRLVSRNTGKFDGANFLTASYEKTGDWNKAIEVLQSQVGGFEKNGDKKELKSHLTKIADIQEGKLNAPDLAFFSLSRAFSNDPHDPALRARLLGLAKRVDVVDELAESYEDEAVKADTAQKPLLAAELREAAAQLYADELGDVARAITTYESVLSAQPGRFFPLEQLSLLYASVGRYSDVERTLRTRLVFKDDPGDRIPILFGLATVLDKHLARPAEAVTLLEEVRRLDATHAGARRALIGLYDQAATLDPLRTLLEEELDATRLDEDTVGYRAARRQLAALLTTRLSDDVAALPLLEAMRAEESVRGATDGVFEALEALYTRSNDRNALKALYEDALAHNADRTVVATLTAKLSDVLVELGGSEEAVDRHLEVLAVEPQNQASLSALRKLYWQLGRYDELATLLRRLMRTTVHAAALKDLRFQLAEVLGDKLDKRAEATETGRRILDLAPHSSEELLRLCAIFRSSEAYEELADVLGRAAEATVDTPARLALLDEQASVFEERLHRRELAAPAFERILQAEPSNDNAYRKLTRVYTAQNNWSRLVALKDERAKRTSDVVQRVTLLREVADIYEQKLQQPALAFLAAARAFREHADDRDVAAHMDRLGVETDSVDELVTIYDDALDGKFTDDVRIIETHVRMAELASTHLSSPKDAEQHYKRALEHDPRHTQALEGLVALHVGAGRFADAVAVYERRIAKSTDAVGNVAILKKIAAILDGQANDVDGAIDAYTRILQIDELDTDALATFAELLERRGRFQQLVTVLRRQEALAGTDVERHALRHRIGVLWEQHIGNAEHAIATFREILAEDAHHLASLRSLENLYTAQHRHRDLVDVFERMLEAVTANDERIRLLYKISATWEEALEDTAQAVSANMRILEIDERQLRAIENLERLYRVRADWEAMVRVLGHHLKLTTDKADRVRLLLATGEVYGAELARHDKAEEMFQSALEVDPSSREATHALGKLYEKSGNWFNALEKLSSEAQILGHSPQAVEIYHRIGSINESMLMDPTNASIAYRAALDIDDGFLPSIRALKLLAKANGDKSQYLQWLRAEANHTPDELGRTEVHTATGRFLQDDVGDLDGAAQEFEKALAITFDHLDAARPLADITFRDEKWQRAEQLLDIIVDRLDPQNDVEELCRQHYRLGYVCEKLGRDAKALKHYQRAFELDAKFLPALEGLGMALSRAGRFEEATKIYNAILIHHRDGLTDAEVVDYHHQLADLNYRIGQNDKANKSLENALKLDNNHAPSLRLLANVQMTAGAYEDAYETLLRVVPLCFGEDRVQLLAEIGRLAQTELEDPYRAIDAFEDANRQKPGDKLILDALLGLYRQVRQGPRAVEVLEELLRLESDAAAKVRFNQTLGEVYRDELRNEARAAQYFNAALDADPTFFKAFEAMEQMFSDSQNWVGLEQNYIAMLKRIPDTRTHVKEVLWRNLGDLYRFRLKNIEGATAAFRVLMRIQPNNAEVTEVLADLLSRTAATLPEAQQTYQRVIKQNPDRLQRTLHELVRIALAQKENDKALVWSQALRVLQDTKPNEQEVLALYAKQPPAQAKRRMTDKLWETLLVHPDVRSPVGAMSAILWQSAGSVLSQSPKELKLDQRKLWEPRDLSAPVVPYFITMLKQVAAVLDISGVALFERVDSADGLQPLRLEQPALAIGKQSALLKETQGKLLQFHIAQKLTGMRRAFILPRTLGPQAFSVLIDVAIRMVEPRYPVRGDPAEVAYFEKALGRLGAPLANVLAPVVQSLLRNEVQKTGQAVVTKPFIEGIEHTAIRAGYLVTGDLDLSMALLKQPDLVAVPHGTKVRELLLFAVADEALELRQRLGTAWGAT